MLPIEEAIELHQQGRFGEAKKMYKKLLVEEEANPKLLFLLGTLEYQTGSVRSAAAYLEKSTAIDPNNALAWNNLGLVQQSLEKYKESETAFLKSIEVNRNYVSAYSNLAVFYRNQKKWKLAEDYLRKAVDKEPQSFDLLYNLALVLFEQKKYEESLRLFRKVIPAESDLYDIPYKTAQCLYHLGKAEEAEPYILQALSADKERVDVFLTAASIYKKKNNNQKTYFYLEKAVALDAKNPAVFSELGSLAFEEKNYETAAYYYEKAYELDGDRENLSNNIGLAYKAMGKGDKAKKWFKTAIALNETNPLALNNLATIYDSEENFIIAEKYVKAALREEPRNADALYNLGTIYLKQGKDKEALACFMDTISIAPGYGSAYNHAAVIYRKRNELKKAEKYFLKALQLNPESAQLLNNIGFLYHSLLRLEEAENFFKRAVKTDYRLAEAHKNRAMNFLLAGKMEKGWREYKWRWKCDLKPRTYPKPEWDGFFEPGKRIFVYPEQGFGDTIQFFRYLSLFKEKGMEVVFESPPELLPLIKDYRDILTIKIMGKEIPAADEYDTHTSLLNLPGYFNTTLYNVPSKTPYLSVPEEYRRKWRGRVDRDKFSIGVVWAGNPTHGNDRNRSCHPGLFSRFATEGVEIYSLQKGEARQQLQKGSFPFIDLGGEINDFADTAALIEQLDLILSVDTSVIHLAGALGGNVWALLPYCPDWRWLTGRTDSPWYPSLRLFRQPQPGDWESLFAFTAEKLTIEREKEN